LPRPRRFSQSHTCSRTITREDYAGRLCRFPSAVRELQQHGKLTDLNELRSSKYLNNLIEQDHRNVKSRLGTMLGLKSFASAAITIRGVELMHRIRKGQFDLRALGTQGQTPSDIWQLVWLSDR
jgi:hypothetical protein